MGQNKVFLSIGGVNLLESICHLFHQLFPQVIVVTNYRNELLHLDAELVTDIFPHLGSLGGIYTGLQFSSHPYAFVTACDMPFLRRDLIEYMMSLTDGYDVVIPVSDTGYEPLHAIYSKRCLGPMKSLLEMGNPKVIGFFDKVRVREVGQEELEPFQGPPSPFFNINTPEDFEKAKSMVLKRRG